MNKWEPKDNGYFISEYKNKLLSKKKFLEEMGQIPTDMGYAIKSNMIKKVFEHEKSIPVKSVKYDKATIYEKMLPTIALVVVLVDEKK